MKFSAKGILMAVKESSGNYEGKAFSSTTFHLSVDLPDNSAGRSLGSVTRPFKFGDAKEFDKWLQYEKQLKAGGLPVSLELEMVAGADKASVITLAGISAAKV